MTEKLLKDPRWRRRNRMCTLLSLMPVVGWLGFLYMGKQSGRRQFRAAGNTYMILSLAAVLVYIVSQIRLLAYGIRSDMQMYSTILLVLLWPVCMAHTLASGGRYLEYLALRRGSQPDRNPLVYDRKWSQKNLRWVLWCITPLTAGFSILFAGIRMKDKKIRRRGVAATVLSVLLFVLVPFWMEWLLYRFAWDDVAFSIILWLTPILWIGCTVYAFAIREDFLDKWVVTWQADVRRQRNLLNPKWCRRNSAWRVWTYFPLTGGIGIALAGNRTGKKKYIFTGILICLLNAAGLVIVTLLDGNAMFANLLRDVRWAIEAAIRFLMFALYWFTLFWGMVIRWDVLYRKSEKLQGYASEFERELDLQNRRRALEGKKQELPVEAKPAVTEQIPEPEPVRTPVPEVQKIPATQVIHRAVDVTPQMTAETRTEGKINLNTCTQADLMTLPGIGVAQAKHAMEYRAAKGGFRSVDEFVEAVKLKPHFAVQVFAGVEVDAPPAYYRETAPETGAGGRIFDF